jgi:hypothetical protein
MYTFCQSNLNASQFTFENPYNNNPNSYKHVEDILIQIMDDADVVRLGFPGRSREWGLLVCDGQPYNVAAKLQDNLVQCPECNKRVLKLEVKGHIKSEHRDSTLEENSFQRVFANLLFLPGLGHFELNMLRSYFKLTWDVLLKHVAQTMNFTSPKAKTSLLKVYDHHKGWQTFLTFL